jgi:hypothetical protein
MANFKVFDEVQLADLNAAQRQALRAFIQEIPDADPAEVTAVSIQRENTAAGPRVRAAVQFLRTKTDGELLAGETIYEVIP